MLDRGTRPVFLAVLFLLLIALLVPFAPSCGAGAPPLVSVAGEASNRLTPALVAIEAALGETAIARGEDPEKTVAPSWDRFWAAWKIWTAAQRAWADAYERGAPDLAQLEAAARAALCAARAALPPGVPPEVLVVAGIACAALPAPQALPSVLPDAGAVDALPSSQDGGR